jgi:hypothetical protein
MGIRPELVTLVATGIVAVLIFSRAKEIDAALLRRRKVRP